MYMSSRVQTVFYRTKYLLGQYGRLVALALVLLSTVAFAGSALAYNAPPETEQITEQTDVQSFETTVNTSAAVTGNTTLYESDRRLSNMPVYLLGASPNVTMSAHTDVPDDRVVEVTQQITIELYATQDDEVFWTETETLAADTQRVTNGTLVTETTVNVREIRRDRLSDVRSEIQRVGTIHAKVHVDTVYTSERYQGRLTVTTPMEITDRAYSVDSPRSDERSHATPVTRTITESGEEITVNAPVVVNGTARAGLVPAFGVGSVTISEESAVLGGVGLFALVAALGVWRLHSRLPDREQLKQTYDKARYGEWMSVGTIPDADSYERVPVGGLTDLIDIAIDSDKRIIRDPEQSLYAVIDGTVIYEYTEAMHRERRSEHQAGRTPGEAEKQNGIPEESAGLDGRLDSLWSKTTGQNENGAEKLLSDAPPDDGRAEMLSDGGVDEQSAE
jgi:hypothetical protein